MTRFPALLACVTVVLLSACAAKVDPSAPPPASAFYPEIVDEDITIPAIAQRDVLPGYERQEVAYNGDEKPGTIVVDTFARRLYHVQENGMATRYAIAVGREGLSFRGSGVIGRKEKWPSWQPTANMIRTRPDLYAEYAGGLDGGLDNPLGARAMYLYRNGADSKFRIHGSIQNEAIGRATSAGCIRLFNHDAIYLFDQVKIGTRVVVRSAEESERLEGRFMEDAWGRAIMDTPENRDLVQSERIVRAETELAEAKAKREAIEAAEKEAAKAEKKRLRQCKAQGLAEADCPPLPQPEDSAEAEKGKKKKKSDKPLTLDEAKSAEEAAAANLVTVKADVARLAACKKAGVEEKDCPAAELAEAAN